MELLHRLKNLIWSAGDEDEGWEEPRREPRVSASEPCSRKVLLVRPDYYVNVGLLAHYMCAGYVVLMDLSEVSPEGVRRIVDFLSGAAYSRDAQLLQISCKAYLLAPANVEVLDWAEVKGEAWTYDTAFNF